MGQLSGLMKNMHNISLWSAVALPRTANHGNDFVRLFQESCHYGLWRHTLKILQIAPKTRSLQNAQFALYGFNILSEISKAHFEMSHQILNPYTDKYAFYEVLNVWRIMIF